MMEQNNNDGPSAATSDAVASKMPEARTSNQSEETARGSNKDLMDFYQRRGARSMAKLDARRNKPERKYDVDILSDKDLERLTISLQNIEEDGRRNVARATDEERERFERYKHHGFVKRWQPSSPDAPLDEEWFISDPEVLPEDDPGYLCEMCRHLNFDALFTQRGLPGNNVPSLPTQIQVYGVWGMLQDPDNSCAVCRLLRRKITATGSLSQVSDEDIEDGQFYINVLDDGPEYALKLEYELKVEGRTVERIVVQRIREQTDQPLAGRFVQQDQADMDRLRQWLHICDSTHPASGKGLETDMSSLRIIDTEELRVREVATPCRYACLSYVWGEGSQTQYTTTTKNSLEAPNGLQNVELPQTIRDAIKVTQEAGLRYLWVDALCILQDDPEDKGKIISKMGPIYGGAALTVIASANADPHEGLPGIGSAHRSVAQDRVRIQGITMAVALHDPRQLIPDIDDSVWSSRAWTFQERALSARSVYFTDSQMVFKCAHSDVMLEEAVAVPDPAFRHPAIEDQAETDLMALLWKHPSLSRFENKGFSGRNQDSTLMISGDIDIQEFMKMSLKERRKIVPVFDITVDAPRDFMGSLADPDETPWDLYRRAVEDYTKRKLTWESDAVDAFSGVEHIVRRGMNTKFWFGLPSFAFEQALLWQAKEPLERRYSDNKAIFPSWSWAGWRGQVSYRGRGFKNSVLWDPVSVTRWYIREDPQWFIDDFKAEQERSVEEVLTFAKKVFSSRLLLRELNFFSLRHLDTEEDKDGWDVKHDEVYNRHIYSHDAYPGVRLTYPVSLPGETIRDLPDTNGVLVFNAKVVPIALYDTRKDTFKKQVEDQFLQLGINDQSRSANYRPPWQRIVYHQGYRAGFLTLNSEHHLPIADEDEGFEFHLAAITRGSLPHVPPPPAGWGKYWNMEPREIQYHLFQEQWTMGPSKVNVPNEEAEPYTQPQSEDGDPHWDTGRFNGIAVFDVYDVLVLVTKNGISRRMGAGKVNYCAFSAAQPEDMLVKLA